MNDKTDSGKPAEIPYKWADAHIKAMHGRYGLGGQKHPKAYGDSFVSAGIGEHDAKAEYEDQKRKAEDFVNEHVVSGVFVPPSRTRFPVYDGGRKYYGRDDSLYRARKTAAEKLNELRDDKALPEK